MAETSDTHRKPPVGWWLPDPRNMSDEQAARTKFFAGWVVRLLVTASVCFGVLIYTEGGVSLVGAAAAMGLFLCGIGVIFALVCWFIWNDDLRGY